MEYETPEHLKHCATETVSGKSFVTRPEYPGVPQPSGIGSGNGGALLTKELEEAEWFSEPRYSLPAVGVAGFRPLTYLACPYSTPNPEEKEWRYQQVTLAAAWLTDHYGLTVFSPITHSHPMHTIGCCKGDWSFWEKVDRDYLAVSNQLIILLLEGWDRSTGLNAELGLARDAGIPVHYLLVLAGGMAGSYMIVKEPSLFSTLKFYPAQESIEEQKRCKVPGGMTNPKDLVGDTKPQLHLVPPTALVRCAKVFELGAKKYGPYNWRGNAVRRTVYLSAAMRHLAEDLDGEDVDSESLQSHVAHAMACCAIIIDSEETGNQIDDRPPAGCTARLIRELTVKKPV
jgi:hypothetical protein